MLQFARKIESVFAKPGFFQKALMSTRILTMNNLSTIKGAFKKRRRWGRGIGSGRGKTCGWGHQKSRSSPRSFEGGQTPLYKRFPKLGFHNFAKKDIEQLHLGTLQAFIEQGRLIPTVDRPLTIRDLYCAGLISNVREGVKLLANEGEILKTPLHLELNDASKEAIRLVEKIGGTVTCIHLNRLALKAMIKPYRFPVLPYRARPPPNTIEKYLDRTKCGYLSPEIQIRNLKLFGAITSENRYREEHAKFMIARREEKIRLGIVEHSPKFARPVFVKDKATIREGFDEHLNEIQL